MEQEELRPSFWLYVKVMRVLQVWFQNVLFILVFQHVNPHHPLGTPQWIHMQSKSTKCSLLTLSLKSVTCKLLRNLSGKAAARSTFGIPTLGLIKVISKGTSGWILRLLSKYKRPFLGSVHLNLTNACVGGNALFTF